MKIRVEVTDENSHKANDMIQDIACDLLDKYPTAETDMEKLQKEQIVEILVNK